MATYCCSVCRSTVVDDSPIPVCNRTSRCGLLFDYEVVATPVPAKRDVRFALMGSPSDFYPGEDRDYAVTYRGEIIGAVQRCAGLLVDPDDESKGFRPDGWTFSGQRRTGEGSSRYAAVADAFARG